MSYITREDGERFVIPSYRDTLTFKQKTALKNEILTLSKSYGELITLQRKGPTQYEVAFSPDRGYLLGESIWSYFQKPQDLIYCEAITGTTEAILVIVKNSSVYLDGSFPIDSIPEELVVFLTEQNNFEIYTYGDVPISKSPEDGKFAFDSSSVKSFTELDKPIFPTLPLVKSYQFELVNTVLKTQGIGVFPAKQFGIAIGSIVVIWILWSTVFTPKEVPPPPPPPPPQINPFQGYFDGLETPTPDSMINIFLDEMKTLYSMPGWFIKDASFANGAVNANVQSQGSPVRNLLRWAELNHTTVAIKRDGISVSISLPTENRSEPKNIYKIRLMIAQLVDKFATIYPGNHFQLGEFNSHGDYTDMNIVIALDSVSPELMFMIGQQLKNYPITLQSINVSVNNNGMNGAINLTLLGD